MFLFLKLFIFKPNIIIKESNEEVVIWLSINQFQTIFNHEKYLNDEALKNDKPS